jgi:hypothetical protein
MHVAILLQTLVAAGARGQVQAADEPLVLLPPFVVDTPPAPARAPRPDASEPDSARRDSVEAAADNGI